MQTQVSSPGVRFMMRGIVVLGLISLIWLSGCTEEAKSPWHIETVDGGCNVGHTWLALDSRGHPHIGYQDIDFSFQDDAKGRSYLKYAVGKGSSWDIKTVDSEGLAGGYTSSLAIDGSGVAHISYTDCGVKYATWDGSSWEIQTVDRAGTFSSLELDRSGYPHISYYDIANGDLKYAVWNGSSWDIEIVDSEGRVGFDCSLALDRNDHPHISYGAFDRSLGESVTIPRDESNTGLKYATWDGSTWNTHTVDSALTMVHGISLAVDGNGYAHIAYWDSDSLRYAAWNGYSWDIQTVDSTERNVGAHSSLTLDSSGHAHISYWGKRLKYAAWDGSSWDIQVVDNARQMSWFTFPAQDMVPINTSLALDRSGFAHISYGGDYRLKYATNAPSYRAQTGTGSE